MTEKEKMLAGRLYDPSAPELSKRRKTAHALCLKYNSTAETDSSRAEILRELLPHLGKRGYIQGPAFFDYGENFVTGENFYVNFNFTALDCAEIKIGDNVFFGPNCSLYTPIHPLLAEERKIRRKADGTLYDLEYAAPITIEDGCWIAGGVTICGGVTIGKNSVIGAGSVVTRDIPSGVFAAGNPCRVIRDITENDSIYKKDFLFEK